MEKSVKIVPMRKHRGSHRMETRIFARNIHETYCREKGCKFHGKPAVQGHCHTTTTFMGDGDWSYIDRAERFASEELKAAKKAYRGREYLRHLESCFVCGWINQINMLDNLVHMRREIALLRHRVRKAANKKSSS